MINADLSQPLTLDTGTFTITNAGQIEANTLLDIDSPVNNANGVISIGAGGTLRLLDSASISGNVQFNGANATLQLDVAGNPISGYVAGAIAGDAIDFSSVITPFSASNSLHWKQKGAAGGVLSLVNSSGSTLASVTLAGSFIASDFSMSKNGSDTLATIVASVPWSTANDFNGDAKSDILWRQSGTNTLADWSMNGSTICQSNVLSAAPDSSWSVAGIGDFNGDGKADILWRQSGTNTLADWTMNGGVIAQSNVLSAAPDSSWSVAGIGDFNGDGDADILWRQSGTNTLADWTMNGSTISQSNVLSAAPDSSWSVAGIGDFNGDGNADILWRQSGTNTLADWTMNGSTISQSNVLSVAPNSSWSVAGIGDFNGDGNADILWRQSGTSTLAEWLMNGSTITSSQVIGAAPDSTWSIVEIGDFNGDGKSDILWRRHQRHARRMADERVDDLVEPRPRRRPLTPRGASRRSPPILPDGRRAEVRHPDGHRSRLIKTPDQISERPPQDGFFVCGQRSKNEIWLTVANGGHSRHRKILDAIGQERTLANRQPASINEDRP